MPRSTQLHRILHGMRRFASHVDDVLLLVGVAIGDLEAKPMTALKLAAYVGMPRGTVIRRLARMARAGLVARDGRGCHTSPCASLWLALACLS